MGAYQWIHTPGGRRFFDRLKINLPLLGNLIRKTAIARFARSLGAMVHGGVPLMEADFSNIGLEQPLHKLGGATLLNDKTIDQIEKMLEGSYNIDAVNSFREKYLPLADGNSVYRILTEVTK